ncbi:MAG: response regulator transcription factor [Bacteroidales bacterium]
MKILIIEDERELALSIEEYLKKENQLCDVAGNLKKATEKMDEVLYDCFVIDIGLPDGNGLDLIPLIKERDSNAGILILTARDALSDKITSLESGADDYLTKPFHLSELAARLKAIYRRRNLGGNTVIRHNEIEVIIQTRIVKVNGKPLTLTRKEYDLLVYFLSNKERVLSRESIVEHLWGDEVIMADTFDFLYTHIKNLRKKIMDKGGRDYIKSVYGIGYRFTDP